MSVVAARTLATNVGLVDLPLFMPSVSSVKSDLRPAEVVEILVSAGSPAMLYSAYDYDHATDEDRGRIESAVHQATNRGDVVFMDSGRYESYWLRDKTWTEGRYRGTLPTASQGYCFMYDVPQETRDATLIAGAVVGQTVADQGFAKSAVIVPIVHGPPDVLPEAVARVAKSLAPQVIAVAERELGDGLLNRASTVREIRNNLDEASPQTALHLLGTGNPLSILVYASMGADTFDGLEWCQTVVDHRSGRLFHLQQYDLFRDQTDLAAVDVPYRAKAMVHNLVFLTTWMDRVRRDVRSPDHPLLFESLERENAHGAVRHLGEVLGVK
jgi:queuine/archaeosine tRNA-ribosyltransferase